MKKQDRPLVIAVTGLNAIDSPGPGVAVIRALRQDIKKLRVIGLSYESLEPGLYLHDLVDKTYQIPYPAAGADALFARLEDIAKKEKVDMVIPNFDAELFNFIRIAPRLKMIGINTFLPSHEQLESRDKVNLLKFGTKNGFKVPQDAILHKENELGQAAEDLGYPLVVKGKYYDAYIAHTADQAHKAFRQVTAKWGLPVITQKFIKGTEINIAALGDGKGNAVSVIPMRKLYITDKGKAWAGITLEDAELIALAEQFTKATCWKGGFELEVMRDSEGGLYIMEINPRFPAWIYLTAAAGQNQPEMLVRLTMGHDVEIMREYQAGKIFIRYSWDHITDISEFQQISAFGEL